ncbi:hypothetical protein A2U01_0075679, partial [Trifolium medium]|nr:hypothetical protein [Trifolium medium]
DNTGARKLRILARPASSYSPSEHPVSWFLKTY